MAAAQSLPALLQKATLDDHEAILKAANSTLKKSKNDANAQSARLVALLRLDRYEDALRALDEGGDQLKARARLERAYALYKTGYLTEAEKIARDGRDDQGLLHVEAQAAYRLENFEHAAEAYSRLLSASLQNEEAGSDLRINQGAAEAQLTWTKAAPRPAKLRLHRGDLEQFETAFNAACCYIARGEMREAEHTLRLARDLCKAAEELSEDQKKDELLPIYIQQIYVYLRLGELSSAETLCAEIGVFDISDKATRHIAQNNVLIASKSPANPYMAHRIFHATVSFNSMDTPFRFQQSSLKRNSLSLDLQANKFGSVKKASQVLAAETSSPRELSNIARLGVIRAAAEAKSKAGKLAIKEMLPLLERRPRDIGLILTIIQLYALTNNVSTATTLLESFLARLEQSSLQTDRDARFTAGLVATLVSMYARQNRITHTKAEVAKASMHWRRRPKHWEYPIALLKTAGAVLLESPTESDIEAARMAFGTVHEQDEDDAQAKAGLLASSEEIASSDVKSAHGLPPVNKLIGGIDVAALEEAGVARTGPQMAAAGIKRPAETVPKPSKPKKIRKSRLPKDYDPEKKPDPERWLPLRERSNWRPKGKKKGKGGAGGMATQGGIASEESRPATPSQQQKPTMASKQKKKKGKGGK